jgi:hypothetical protein
MTWTKLPDGFNDDPALLGLPRGIRLLHVEALVWSNAHGTDGALPRHVLARITDEPDPGIAAEQLVAAGLWTETDEGWAIAFGDQLPAKEVKERREATALRTRRWDHHRRDIHDLCLPRWCAKANALAATSDDASGDALPSRPTRSAREEGRTGTKRSTAARSGLEGRSRHRPPEKVLNTMLWPTTVTRPCAGCGDPISQGEAVVTTTWHRRMHERCATELVS